MALTVGSLFSGFDGLGRGLRAAGMELRWQVEIDTYCRRVLAKHDPNLRRLGDVHDCGARNLERVDLICGGFPCQPVSCAGKRQAEADPRWLWPEFRRVIADLRPELVLVENVPGLLGCGMGAVLGDLSALGYDAEWESLQAGAFGAHFRGDRVYVIASRTTPVSLRWEGFRASTLRTDQWEGAEFERLVQLEVSNGVPAGSLGRISDGVPNRIHRLRGLGNAVPPLIGEWLGRRIVANVPE